MILRRQNLFKSVQPATDVGKPARAFSIHNPARRRNRGFRPATASAELAVLLPFLITMFLGVIDFGRVVYFSMTVDNSLHNSVLFAAQTFDNQNQQWIGNNQYWQGPANQIVSTDAAAAALDGTNLSPPLPASNVTQTTGNDADGNPVVIITVTYTFQTLVPYPGIPSQVVIQRTGQVRVAPAVPG